MQDPVRSPPRPLPPTPALERLIARVRSGVSRLVWMHGLGTVAAAFAGVLLFAFLADWSLHLPRAVRWIHLAFLAGVPAYMLLRDLVRPLGRRPNRAGLAVLVERAHPELKELLVSAVEFKDAPATERAFAAVERGSVERVLTDADRAAQALDASRVLDARGPRQRVLFGVAASVLCVLVLGFNREAADVFFQRIAGANVPWPQRTSLAIEVPINSSAAPKDALASASAERSAPDHDLPTHDLVVRVARGSDVPVLVRAEGVVPEEVTLHFEGGHKAVLAAAGGNVFRTLLRSCQEDLEFYATGGDDVDERPLVRLIVLQPPDVAGIAVHIVPPAYTGLAARTEFDRDVEVIAGSAVTVHVEVDPPDATGVVRVLPDDRVITLAPRPFPNRPDADSTAASRAEASPDGAGTRPGQAFEVVAQKSLRYRFELTDSAGLANPDPGLFGIAVIEDRTPEVEILSPGRGDFDTVLGGLLSLRVRAQDDFGIARMSWSSRAGGQGGGDAPLYEQPLEWAPVERSEEREPDARAAELSDGESPAKGLAGREDALARVQVISRQRIEVARLSGAEPLAEGQQFELVVTAADNAEPTAHEGRSAPVRVRVVSRDEFLRRMQDRLARVQAAASALGELQREKLRRALELLAGMESDALIQEGTSTELAAALFGERRVLGDARAVARELAALVEVVLFARVDERAASALEFIDQRLARATGRGFDPAPWRELAQANRQGDLGASGLASKLVDILGLSLEIGEDHAAQAADALLRAQDATELSKMHAELVTATEAEKKALAKIENLLELLAEWDNFQSVINLTRDILNGQKSLSERTRQHAKEH